MIMAWDMKRLKLVALIEGLPANYLGAALIMTFMTRDSWVEKTMSGKAQEFKKGDWVRYPYVKANVVIPASEKGIVTEVKPDYVHVAKPGSRRGDYWQLNEGSKERGQPLKKDICCKGVNTLIYNPYPITSSHESDIAHRRKGGQFYFILNHSFEPAI